MDAVDLLVLPAVLSLILFYFLVARPSFFLLSMFFLYFLIYIALSLCFPLRFTRKYISNFDFFDLFWFFPILPFLLFILTLISCVLYSCFNHSPPTPSPFLFSFLFSVFFSFVIGARYDPYGPPGANRPWPDNDELPPPGPGSSGAWEDMFM